MEQIDWSWIRKTWTTTKTWRKMKNTRTVNRRIIRKRSRFTESQIWEEFKILKNINSTGDHRSFSNDVVGIDLVRYIDNRFFSSEKLFELNEKFPHPDLEFIAWHTKLYMRTDHGKINPGCGFYLLGVYSFAFQR